MVFAKSLIGAAALFSGVVSALPSGSGNSDFKRQYGSSGYSNSGSSNSGYSNSGYSNSVSVPPEMMSDLATSSVMVESSSVMMDTSSTMMMDTSVTMMMDSSTMMMDSSSTMMMDSSSVMMTESTSAALATSTALAYSTPSYGSGMSSWSSDGYDGCVQQCVASFGSPAATYAPTATSGSSGSVGTGTTWTVIVAPTQGVLRYVPFAVNASVGDTVKFMWGANNHTVTKSSELTPCNKTSDAPFASGEQNLSFVFTQVVNDTNTTFFYCGTPTHCEKGMFGIINPPSAFQAPTSVSGMMPTVISNDTTGNLSTYAAYTSNMTSGSAGANWGSNIDMSAVPSWAYDAVVENVMFTRNVLAMNPDIMAADGSVSLESLGSTPMMIPMDPTALAATTSTSTASSSDSSAASSASASASSAAGSPVGAASNGAMTVTSSKMLVGAIVLVATFFAL